MSEKQSFDPYENKKRIDAQLEEDQKKGKDTVADAVYEMRREQAKKREDAMTPAESDLENYFLKKAREKRKLQSAQKYGEKKSEGYRRIDSFIDTNALPREERSVKMNDIAGEEHNRYQSEKNKDKYVDRNNIDISKIGEFEKGNPSKN